MQPMNKRWLLRDYNEGDEVKINPLLNSIYKIQRSISYWNWEFKENPKGFKTLVAVDGSNVVGHLAALHREIIWGDTAACVSMEVEGVTHPDYQRQGIFVAMGQKLLADLKEEGFSLVYGFPNENALPGHRKLKCIEIFKLHVMIRPLNFKNISKKRMSNKIIGAILGFTGKLAFMLMYRPKRPVLHKDVKIKTISEFDSRFDKLWQEAKSDHKIILKRDSLYLNWRYTQCPQKQYKIYVAEKDDKVLAWVIVRILNRFDLVNGALVDMLGLPNNENVIMALIQRAFDDLKEQNVDLVACSVPKSSIYFSSLKSSGFATCPRKLNPKEEPFIIYPLKKDENMEFIKDPGNWFITWGDTDVI
jgi:GNAT superfamily N-acetyltransferase